MNIVWLVCCQWRKKKQQIRSFGCAHSVERMKIRCICNEYIGLQRDNRKKEKETKKKTRRITGLMRFWIKLYFAEYSIRCYWLVDGGVLQFLSPNMVHIEWNKQCDGTSSYVHQREMKTMMMMMIRIGIVALSKCSFVWYPK